MKSVCLSSSLRFKEIVRDTLQCFESLGIEALFPNLDSGLKKEELDLDAMRKLCQDHFKAIDAADGLYVINPGGYIGTLVTVEIGYASGRRKPVYYSEPAGTLDLDALADGIIPLDRIEVFLSL